MTGYAASSRHAERPMAVYVDDAVTLWRGRRWAHLMADTLVELHAFAQQLGIPRHAFQNRTSGAHYDVPAELRERALALGAVAISLIGLVLFKQRLDLPAVVGLAMIVGGVVVINLFSRAVSH